ncbi:MAG: hypothetical protein FADNKDHG_01352 [Holosporales bacterium]
MFKKTISILKDLQCIILCFTFCAGLFANNDHLSLDELKKRVNEMTYHEAREIENILMKTTTISDAAEVDCVRLVFLYLKEKQHLTSDQLTKIYFRKRIILPPTNFIDELIELKGTTYLSLSIRSFYIDEKKHLVHPSWNDLALDVVHAIESPFLYFWQKAENTGKAVKVE